MGKYTRDELRAMAQEFMRKHTEGNADCREVLVRLTWRFPGLTAFDALRKIDGLAR